MTDQDATGPTGADEAPKNDYVLTGSQEQVKAEPSIEATPKNEPVVDQDEDEADQEDSNKDGSEGKKPKRGGFQKKIGRLEGERDSIAAERDYWRKLAEGVKPGTSSEPAPKKSEHALDLSDPRPEPDTFQGSLQEFNDAQFQWNIRQFEKTQSKKENENKAKADLASKASQYEAAKVKAKEKFSDFDQVLSEYDDIKVEPAITKALLDNAENGPEFAYWLAKNPEEFEKLNKPGVSPTEVYRTYGRFEALQGNPVKAAVKTTNAPQPIKPVGSGMKPAAGKFYEGMPYEDYKKLSKAERG